MELVLKRKGKKCPAGWLLILCVSLLVVWLHEQSAEARKPMAVKVGRGEAKVTALEGTAQCIAEKGKGRSLRVGDALKGGDQVNTGPRSRLELTLADGTVLRFSDNTSFKILQIDCSEEAKTRNAKVNVALGKTWANVSKTFGVKPNIEVSCENAVAGVRGTVYRMNVNEDQSALVRVYDGEVAVSGGGPAVEQPSAGLSAPQAVSGPVSVPGPRKVTMEEWVYIVKSMQQIRIGTTGIPEKPETFTETEDRDDWVDWNRQRDGTVNTQDENPAAEGSGGLFEWFK